MSNIRKQYDREFKVMAVELSKGRSDLSVLAGELEIRPALLYRWRKELETKAGTSFPGNCIMIGMLVARNETKGNRIIRGRLYFPGTEYPG